MFAILQLFLLSIPLVDASRLIDKLHNQQRCSPPPPSVVLGRESRLSSGSEDDTLDLPNIMIPRGGASGSNNNYYRSSSLSYHHPLKGLFGLFSFGKKSAAQH